MSLNINVNVPPRLIEHAREQQVERRLAMVQRQRQAVVRKEAARKVQQERLARGESADGKVPIGGTLEQRRRQWDGATALFGSSRVGALKHYGSNSFNYEVGTETFYVGSTVPGNEAVYISVDYTYDLTETINTSLIPIYGHTPIDPGPCLAFAMLPVRKDSYILVVVRDTGQLRCSICTNTGSRQIQVPGQPFADKINSYSVYEDTHFYGSSSNSEKANGRWGFSGYYYKHNGSGFSNRKYNDIPGIAYHNASSNQTYNAETLAATPRLWTPAIYAVLNEKDPKDMKNLPRDYLAFRETDSSLLFYKTDKINNQTGNVAGWEQMLEADALSQEEYHKTVGGIPQRAAILHPDYSDDPYTHGDYISSEEVITPVTFYGWNGITTALHTYYSRAYTVKDSGDRTSAALSLCWDWDQPEFCRQQLLELGFKPEDLIP